MTSTEDQPVNRPGSAQDLSRRMDKLEGRHEDLAREVGTLSGTVARVEQNQIHAAELNKLRFDALDSGLSGLKVQLDTFMARINGVLSGEVRLPAAQQGEELVREYQVWRATVEDRLDSQVVLNTQVRFLGRIALLVTGGSLVSMVLAIAAFLRS